MAHKPGTGMFIPLYGRSSKLQDEQTGRELSGETLQRPDRVQNRQHATAELEQHHNSSACPAQLKQSLQRGAEGGQECIVDSSGSDDSDCLLQQPLRQQHGASPCPPSCCNTGPGIYNSSSLTGMKRNSFSALSSPYASFSAADAPAVTPRQHSSSSSSTAGGTPRVESVSLSTLRICQNNSAWPASSSMPTPLLHSQPVPARPYLQQLPAQAQLPMSQAGVCEPVMMIPVGGYIMANSDFSPSACVTNPVAPVIVSSSSSSSSAGVPLLSQQGPPGALDGGSWVMQTVGGGGGAGVFSSPSNIIGPGYGGGVGCAGTMSSPSNIVGPRYDPGVGYAGTLSSASNVIVPGCSGGVGVGYAGPTSSCVGAVGAECGFGVGYANTVSTNASTGDGVWCAAGLCGNPVVGNLYPDIGAMTDQNLQMLAALQQQDTKLAEVDATIQQLINIKQQVLAMRQPVLAPAAATVATPAATAVPLWLDMSAQQSLYSVAPPAAAASCTSFSGSFVQQQAQQPPLGPTRSSHSFTCGQQQHAQLALQQSFLAPVGHSSLSAPSGAAQQQQAQLVAAQTELLQMLRLS